MQIFFTASYTGKQTLQDSYDKIIQSLQLNNCKIITLELGKYEDLIDKKTLKNLTKDEAHYRYIKRGMNISNGVIIEASMNRFRLGYEASLALALNKPVLCISKDTDYSQQIKHPNFYGAIYNSLNEIDSIVKDFLKKIKVKHLPVRLHTYVTPTQKTFLDWYGKKVNKSSSEIIRDLIEEKMLITPEFKDN